MTNYAMDDGWDLDNCTPLEDAVDAYESMGRNIYELRNCVRTKDLQEMRDELLRKINEMKEALEGIDDEDVIVEVQ